jgi:prevent-host-death family protein
MSKKYKAATIRSPRLRELPTVTATALKSSTAEVLDQVSRGHAVAITKHDKPRAVLVSYEDYVSWKSKDDEVFETFFEEYQGMLDAMQSPEQKAAALRLFEATPEELGEAALRGAQRRAREKK